MGRILFQKYEMIEQLGQGGAGRVFLAKDKNLNRLVAVKEQTVQENADLCREVELLKELKHPGLPEVYDFFREEESDYLVMEYVDGISLRKYLKKNERVPETLAVKWALELCEILIYLHNCKPAIIYRDLKPENIMIRPDGSIKLIDLGAALRCGFGAGREQLCMGTPGYHPKEQWQGTRGDKNWDIYGLGAVLHEMLTGENPMLPPYERRPLREYDRGLPSGLERIVERCTSESPMDRYQSAEQLKDALCHPGRAGNLPQICWQLKRVIVGVSFLLAVLSLVLPLWKGVPEKEIPFPFLKLPLNLLGVWIFLRCMLLGGAHRGKKRAGYFLQKQEKKIWLTGKKFSGLYVLLVFLLGGVCGMQLPAGNVVYAGKNEDKLWVEMRDEQGRKLLLQDGAVYKPEVSVRFELPVLRLPEEEIRLQMVAEGQDGNIYYSRVFLIDGGEKK